MPFPAQFQSVCSAISPGPSGPWAGDGSQRRGPRLTPRHRSGGVEGGPAMRMVCPLSSCGRPRAPINERNAHSGPATDWPPLKLRRPWYTSCPGLGAKRSLLGLGRGCKELTLATACTPRGIGESRCVNAGPSNRRDQVGSGHARITPTTCKSRIPPIALPWANVLREDPPGASTGEREHKRAHPSAVVVGEVVCLRPR